MTRRKSERELERVVENLDPDESGEELQPYQRTVREMGASREVWADPVDALRWFMKQADEAEADR